MIKIQTSFPSVTSVWDVELIHRHPEGEQIHFIGQIIRHDNRHWSFSMMVDNDTPPIPLPDMACIVRAIEILSVSDLDHIAVQSLFFSKTPIAHEAACEVQSRTFFYEVRECRDHPSSPTKSTDPHLDSPIITDDGSGQETMAPTP